ncbi:hypothetical protein [Neorhizobium sp. IRS_2294]|uniref:hypothetical protein n=1 Tax=unclassified Neorhizobium TaxID=2629175 RepID=UPI003D28376E
MANFVYSAGTQLMYLLFTVLFVFVATQAAACIPTSELKQHGPNTVSYIHETRRDPNIAISVYRKGESFVNFIEVFREKGCITNIEEIDYEQFVSRYLEAPEQWIAEQEGRDREGMDDEEASAPLTTEDLYPFLFPTRFPVTQTYRGPIALPDFKKRERDFYSYRTRITEGMNKGVNFSGEFAVVQIGCGSSCSFAVVGNVRTGQLSKFPRGGEENGPLSLKFSPNSSLVIATWRDGQDCVLESSQFDGKQWVSLAKPVIGTVDQCYEDIRNNISMYIKGNPVLQTAETSIKSNLTEREIQAITSDGTKGQPPEQIKNDGYEDIDSSALLDLYESFNFVSACYQAGRKNTFPYLSQGEMSRAEKALEPAELEIFRRNPKLNKELLKQRAWEASKMPAGLVIASGIEPSYKMAKACRDVYGAFPPNLEKTTRRKASIENKPNTGGGLIKPQSDPRFIQQ